VVSISGCDPLDPGSNPGTAKLSFFSFRYVFLVVQKRRGSTPSGVIHFVVVLFIHKKRFYRDLNPDYKDQNLGC
jgi:hypothetical protein